VRPRGRPRDPAVDAAIIRATQQLLAEQGYARMSLEAIAREAGVAKPTLYRRWSSKADLATDALAALAARESPPVTGDTRADLVSLLRAFQRSLLRPNGLAMLGTVLAEEHHTPELVARFRDRLLRPRRARLLAILEAGRASGQVRADADLDAAVNLLVGSFYARYLTGDGVPRSWPDRVVGVVWPGVATSAS
jgi:AcrR family transcriptional regulator